MLHTKKAFAELACMPTNKLAVFISRKKVILLGDGMIDDADPRNRLFLEKWRGRTDEPIDETEQAPKEKPVKVTKKNAFAGEEEAVIVGTGQTYTESERQLKYLDTIKRQKEIEKLDIDIQKKRGEVVPSELIKPIFLQHNQSILTEFKNATDEILRIFSKKKSLTVNEVAEIKGEMTSCINEAINKAIASSKKAVQSVIDEHKETKWVGEHG